MNILHTGVENRQTRIVVEVRIALGDHIGSICVHEMNRKRVVRVQMVIEARDELVGDLGASREKGVVEAPLVGIGQGHVFFHDLLRHRIDGYLIVLVRLTGKRAHQLGGGHQWGAGQ